MVYDEVLHRHPSRFQRSSNSSLTEFCGSLDLLDPWRFKYPNTKQYSWFKPNDTIKSRIDFWFISASLRNFVSECSMSAAPLTDHAVIKLTLNPGIRKGLVGYWKFNSSLLKNKVFESEILSLISEVMSDLSLSSHSARWEFLKFKIRKFCIFLAKKLSKNGRLSEMSLIKNINTYCSKTSPTEEDKQILQNLLTKLDEIYTHKAKGTYIRSRAKWIEEGEKSILFLPAREKKAGKKLY